MCYLLPHLCGFFYRPRVTVYSRRNSTLKGMERWKPGFLWFQRAVIALGTSTNKSQGLMNSLVGFLPRVVWKQVKAWATAEMILPFAGDSNSADDVVQGNKRRWEISCCWMGFHTTESVFQRKASDNPAPTADRWLLAARYIWDWLSRYKLSY